MCSCDVAVILADERAVALHARLFSKDVEVRGAELYESLKVREPAIENGHASRVTTRESRKSRRRWFDVAIVVAVTQRAERR